jgi:hypothetical protein
MGRRQLIGTSFDLRWHYGVSAIPRLGAYPSFTLINRVIFTTDGRTPVADALKMHGLRRSRCKSWYSDRWRDLLLAFAHSLSCGGNASIELSAQPRLYVSDVRLLAPDDRGTVHCMAGRETGPTDDAWERHGLSRCDAFIAARSHRRSIFGNAPRTSGINCSRSDARSVVTCHCLSK